MDPSLVSLRNRSSTSLSEQGRQKSNEKKVPGGDIEKIVDRF